jgi:hypothetical protein
VSTIWGMLSVLAATFIGLGTDRVGQMNQTTPNGVPDFHIAVPGMRSTPTKITIFSDTGGIWETPFNGTNWIIGTAFVGNGGDLAFEQFPSNTFQVRMVYPDGTTEQVIATPVANQPKPWRIDRDAQNRPVVTVTDQAALDQMLRQTIFAFRDALALGDINTAASYFTLKKQQWWRDRFSHPKGGFDYASVSSWFTQIQWLYQSGPIVQYEIVAGTQGGSITMALEEDGVWRILSL